MIISLKGKTALVCGGSDGIGKATAIGLANTGATVILAARTEDKLKAALAELSVENNQSHSYVMIDLDQPEHLKSKVEQLIAEKGNIDILINNAGGPPAGPITDADGQQFLLAFQRLLLSAQAITQACYPGMKAAGFGRIINIISTSVKAPLHGLGVSNTIRGAVGNWAKTWANETAKFGVTVNNVLPGATETDRLVSIIKNKAEKTGKSIDEISAEMRKEIPADRFAKPEEVAAAVVFLASEQAAYVNGINIPVDGGRTPNL
jgi:3-oxoacyl-[acyl-carrier protein] reductase